MKFLFDIFPVVLFFTAYAVSNNIFLATKVAMIASVIQVVFSLLRHKKVPLMLSASAGLVLILGSLTLYFRNEHFIMWKPSLLFWLMALGLFVSDVIKKNGLRLMLEKQLNLPDKIWRQANFACIFFLSLLGVLNLYVAYHFGEKIWVYFKLFGIFGLNLLFFIALFMYMMRFHVEAEVAEKK